MRKYYIIVIGLLMFFKLDFVYAVDTVKLSSCVDGDTFKVSLNDEIYTVRMLAVNTPEVHPADKLEYYGKEASDYTCDKLTKAKKITLEYDEKSDKYDKYDRLLAWVFVDGNLLQSELVLKGYAKVAYLYNNYKYADELKEKQEVASAKGKGVWDDDARREFDLNKYDDDVIVDANEKYENIEIIGIVILFLIIALFGSKKRK